MSDCSRDSALQVASWMLKHAPEWPKDGPTLSIGPTGLLQLTHGDDTLGQWTHDEWRRILEATLAACHAYATERRIP